MRLINRLRIYERLLQEVVIYLTSGGFVIGTVVGIHTDFITLTTIPNGAIDIPYDSILAISPVTKKKNKGKG